MSKLAERYPTVRRLPPSDTPVDEMGLLSLLEPYLNWVLAEIDTASLDILICTPETALNRKPQHVVLLTGKAVVVWLRHAGSKGDIADSDGQFAEGH